MNQLHVLILLFVAVALPCGCNTNQLKNRISMVEGSLCVNNMSDVDIYPIVKTSREEDLGGVSAGGFKVIGFASINVDGVASVVWAETKYGSATKTTVFPVKLRQQDAMQTKYMEFCYKGQNKWILNLYSAVHPQQKDLVVTIPGQLQLISK